MFHDNRGRILFPIKNNNFTNVKESTVSINNKHVFRGIHLEQFSKLVTCVQGKILDIIINFNEEDDDYLQPKYYELDPTTDLFQIVVKKNHGHSFLSLCENTIVLYHYDDVYDNSKTITLNYKDPVFNIKIPIHDPIISDNDLNAPFFADSLINNKTNKNYDFLVFGGKGFIGSVIINQLEKLNKTFYVSRLRLENVGEIEKELDLIKPKYVISSAGITGTPNISWCETHKVETIETNITYQMTLASCCRKRNIHFTIIGSGVIFKNDKFYDESEEGNFFSNFYGKCRINLENMCKHYENVLYARVNYPISSIKSSKNLITKLLSYETIENKEITLTYIDELIPYLLDMIQNNETGICNLVNEGTINLTTVLDTYATIKSHTYKISEKIDSEKSSSLLKIGKLNKYNVMSTLSAVNECLINYNINNE